MRVSLNILPLCILSLPLPLGGRMARL